MTAYLVTVRSQADATVPRQLYLLDGALSSDDLHHLTTELLHDPVTQEVIWTALDQLGEHQPTRESTYIVEVAYKPGVTDNEAESVKIGAARLGIKGLQVVKTLYQHLCQCTEDALAATQSGLHNPLIQTTLTYHSQTDSSTDRLAFYTTLIHPPADTPPQIAQVPLLESDDDELLRISREGVLSLDLAEMHAIRDYFRQEERAPTDGELETLAQTWSEHCYHKTFKAQINYRVQSASSSKLPLHIDTQCHPAYQMLQSDCVIDSMIRTFLMEATNTILARSHQPWVLSAFVDNAGIVSFGDAHELSFKVETHNHPSALEPFGGANTGVGGVVRDVLGVSAQPIANTNVLCFGPLDLPTETLSAGMLPPRTIASGVVAGVRDYGNKLGIPTVNGAVLYDPGYIANPLVFCGTVGLAPRGRHPRNVQPGDTIVVLGGRTGRDGIHGATFSSAELTHTTAEDVGSAVQIGDPITEKKTLDIILQARDAGLYNAITDCGAGGLSSAVGEMGEETGAQVELTHVSLKYAGLQPWEIWLSEAQERMVLAVPQQHLDTLLHLCADEDVEATVIGQFTDDQRLTVTHNGATLVDLSMAFLHKGIPQRKLAAVWETTEPDETTSSHTLQDFTEVLLALLAHPNIASKEPIIRTYDHEVGGRTVIKPLVGTQSDGPGDATVMQPIYTDSQGLVIGCGINPRYGEIDPYWMALACIDEALRNVVAVGGDPAQTAILDNFCWGDPRKPDRMAGLVRAAAGCYDAALAYDTPFISGKDSLNNEYRDANGVALAIPPTLLISALALVPEVQHTITMDVKEAGNYIYLVGETYDELGGSHYDVVCGTNHAQVPQVNLALAPIILQRIYIAIRAGWVAACHDLSEGGLAVAAAEMAFAGELGMELYLAIVPRPADLNDDTVLLFAESPTRFLVEVPSEHAELFEQYIRDVPYAQIGTVTDAPMFIVNSVAGTPCVQVSTSELKASWQGTVVV
ncbi:MAG: phosphoribosylformylglycinamidine synthase subunit PurL [Chloroflexota bacterium]